MAVNKKVVEETKKVCDKLFSLMGVDIDYTVSLDKDNDAVFVKIEPGESSGLLIGSRGETIRSLQSALGMIVKHKVGDWTRIVVDVADWRDKQKERLVKLADSVVERVEQTGEPQPLYNLSAGERREIHMHLADSKEYETESVGEGDERYLVIKKKNS